MDSIKIREIIRKPIFKIGIVIVFVCFFSFENDWRIKRKNIPEDYDFMHLSIRPQDKYRRLYSKLIIELQKFNTIEKICSNDGGLLKGVDCEIINEYITTPGLEEKYTKIESRLSSGKEQDTKTYTLSELEKTIGFEYEDFNKVFFIMKLLKIHWISRENDIIEFSKYVYIADSSLDVYDGYLYCPDDTISQINRNKYVAIKHLDTNWYYFIRDVKQKTTHNTK